MTGTAGRCRMPTIGVSSLDSDHRCLHRVIDLLIGVGDPREATTMVATVLAMVSEYAWFHFEREERVVAHLGYSGASVRAAEHRAFARLLESLRARHGTAASAAAASDVHSQLLGWLYHHVTLFDVGLIPSIADPVAVDRVARSGAPVSLLPRRPVTPRLRSGRIAPDAAAVTA